MGTDTSANRAAHGLARLLLGAGAAHFVIPRPFDTIVPKALPGPARTWTHLSGAAELAVGAAVLYPPTRRRGALAAAGLFAAVFPANVKMALDWRAKPKPLRAAAYARLPLQLPLIGLALYVAKKS